ncbi:MAG: hypothetical protein K2W97_00935 [Chthoniobacterales bacterium]|nr:hypothetical protein [Chthoniobacterales bacterium]
MMFLPVVSSLLLLTGSLLPTQMLPHRSSSQVLLVDEYAECLEKTARFSDLHHQYDCAMSDQIESVEKEDGIHYLAVPGQGEQPMQHLACIDVMRYCNWRDNQDTEHGSYELEGDEVIGTSPGAYLIDDEKSQDGIYYISINGDELSKSPLMMLGRTTPEEKNQKEKSLNEANQHQRQRDATAPGNDEENSNQDEESKTATADSSTAADKWIDNELLTHILLPNLPQNATIDSSERLKSLWQASKNTEPFKTMFAQAGIRSLKDLKDSNKRVVFGSLCEQKFFERTGQVPSVIDATDLDLRNSFDLDILRNRRAVAVQTAKFEAGWRRQQLAETTRQRLVHEAGAKGQELLKDIKFYQDDNGVIFPSASSEELDFLHNETHLALIHTALLNFGRRNQIAEDLPTLREKIVKDASEARSGQLQFLPLDDLREVAQEAGKGNFNYNDPTNVRAILASLRMIEEDKKAAEKQSSSTTVPIAQEASPSLNNLSVKKLVLLNGEIAEKALLYCDFPGIFDKKNPAHTQAIIDLAKRYQKEHPLGIKVRKGLFIVDDSITRASGTMMEYPMLPQMSFFEKVWTAYTAMRYGERSVPPWKSALALSTIAALGYGPYHIGTHYFGFNPYSPRDWSTVMRTGYSPMRKIAKGSKEYCDLYLERMFAPNSEQKTPSWIQFTATPKTVCQEMVQQPKKNLDFLLQRLHEWQGATPDEVNRYPGTLPRTEHVGKRLKELPGVFADCYQHWSCSSTALQSAKKTFGQQQQVIDLLSLRMEREQQAKQLELSLSYYSGPDDLAKYKTLNEDHSSLTNRLSQEKALAQKALKFKDPDSQKALFTKTQKAAFNKYYQAAKEHLKKLGDQLAQNGNSEETATTKVEL